VKTLARPGWGIAHRIPTAAAATDRPAPRPRTALAPNRSVRVPDRGAPTPDATPKAITV